jgi:hypothetical protein
MKFTAKMAVAEENFMKKVFVANPSRRKAKAKAHKKTRRGRTNPLPLVIGNPRRITTMAKRKRSKAGAGKNARPHRRNPVTRRRRNHRNPLPATGMGAVKLIFGSAAGLLSSVYVPSWLLAALGQPDSGVFSYALAVLATIVPAYFLEKMPDVAKGWLAGGGAGVVWRLVDDFTGSQALVIQSGGSGMGSFFTKPVTFPLPAQSVFGPYARGGRPALPPAMPTGGAAPVAGKHGMNWVQM